uniref:Uncharacterized protein n=1 Tax=Timema poppense TaxID=170557 RepID=A0A7R9HBD6_TIMPO|nr:unnamed protein product [Timema poppensis]
MWRVEPLVRVEYPMRHTDRLKITFVCSFGRVPSQEDVDGSSLDLTAVFISEEGTKEHEFDITEKLTDCIQTKQFEKCTSESHSHQGKKKGRWRKALHTLKPKSSKIDLKTIVPPSTDLATTTSIVIPPITLSSPSLLQDLKEPLSGLQLRNVSTVLDINSLNQPVVRWMKSQSMQVM